MKLFSICIVRVSIAFFCLLGVVSSGFAQEDQFVIEGKVSAFNRYPLKGVAILAKKSKIKTTTDANGHFSVSCRKNDLLAIKAAGFQSQNIKLKYDSFLDINLIFMNSDKAFEMAVADSLISESNLRYAVDNLLDENNDYSRFQTIFDLLQAKYPMAKVSENSGVQKVYLTSMGPNSLYAGSDALLIVDGVPVEDIAGIQTTQVADIRVVTGTETSMYGNRGANGVVEIKLKYK